MLQTEFDWDDFLMPYKQAVEELSLKFTLLRDEYISRGEYSPIHYISKRVKSVNSIMEAMRVGSSSMAMISIANMVITKNNLRSAVNTAEVGISSTRSGIIIAIDHLIILFFFTVVFSILYNNPIHKYITTSKAFLVARRISPVIVASPMV